LGKWNGEFLTTDFTDDTDLIRYGCWVAHVVVQAARRSFQF
jgi:hypothetical protein